MTTDKNISEETIYTDGHGVKITNRNFYTEDQTYLIEGITDVKVIKKPAGNWSAVLLFILGLAGLVIGSFEYLADWGFTVGNTDYVADTNTIAIVAGVILFVLGIILFVARKDHYAVGIRTAEGLREPVKSKNKEYAVHLANMLRETYHRHFGTVEKRIKPAVH